MKNDINASVIGTVVNISLNGVLHTKNCGSTDGANDMFRAILKAKKDPTEDNISTILGFLNKGIRVARKAGLESDPETGMVYMEGFNTPLPELLVDTLENYDENDFPMESIVNFWKLLMANPDKTVRKDLFKFIQTHDFSLTDSGYMIVYKAVSTLQDNEQDLPSFVSNQYLHVRKKWFTSPKRYVVYKLSETGELKLTKKVTFIKWDLNEKGVEEVGCLDELFGDMDSLIDDETTIFTDLHTKKMEIRLGVPVTKERRECDADKSNECSNGLHVGATKYVTTFGGKSAPVLVCLVNPMNVIAVPEYDNSKMRVCEYYPYALATRDDDGVIDIIEQKFFETDYISHEVTELNKLIELVKADEEREVCYNAEEEEREQEEILKILKTRVVDLSV